jgi:hypothetical protein
MSVQLVSTDPSRHGTCRADRFREAVRQHNGGGLKTLPIRGSERAIRRKLDASLNLSIDEATAILFYAPDVEAIAYLRALTADAGKDDRIDVAPCAPAEVCDVPTAELEFCAEAARFVALVDEERHGMHHSSVLLRRIHDEQVGVAARSRALLSALES